MNAQVSRRRFLNLTVNALVSASATAGAAALASSRQKVDSTSASVRQWRGILFGAEVSMRFIGVSQQELDDYLPTLLAKMQRLESSFSLYQSNSELNRLNETGLIIKPSSVFVDLMQKAQYYYQLTNGVFDPTVQTYAQASQSTAIEMMDSMSKVSFDQVQIRPSSISYQNEAIKCSLNGIAQGYITDCMVTELESQGWGKALVNFGEYYAMDNDAYNQPWELTLHDPNSRNLRNSHDSHLLGKGRALAVSSGSTYNLMGDNIEHLYHPKLGEHGQFAPKHSFSWVEAPSATCADALSTAYAVMSTSERQQLKQTCSKNKLDVVFS